MITNVSTFEEMRKEMLESSQQLDMIFNTLPQSLALVTPDYKIVRVNNNFLSLYGMKNEDVVGKKCHYACFGRDTVCDNCLVEKVLVTKRTEKKVKSFPNGEVCEMTAHPVFNEKGELTHVLDMRTNITELVESQREVRRIRFAMDQSTDEFWLFDKNWNVAYASQSAAKNLGYSISELYGANIGKFNLIYRLENLCALFDRLKKKKNIRIESIQYQKDGSTYPCEMNLSYFADQDEYVYAVVRDITKRKKRENEMVDAREKAERASRLKSSFLANMSHEIRTPLNAIIGFSNFVLEEQLDEETKAEMKRDIKTNSDYLLSIISDIIEMSKLESGNIVPKNKAFNLSALTKATFEKYQSLCPGKLNFLLALNVPDEFEIVHSDHTVISQITEHLIRNAFKFTSKGEVELGCDFNPQKSTYKIYIKDTGIGIAPEHLDEIFEPFLQINPMIQGVGIGLTICKGLASLLETSIHVNSVLGKGSEFSFTLKQAQPAL